jgi:hypothetical protein
MQQTYRKSDCEVCSGIFLIDFDGTRFSHAEKAIVKSAAGFS